jgi:hypothetical protein
MELVVSHDGVIRFVYDERLDLSACGTPTIRRASQVEPQDGAGWSADLGPVDGPVLGPYPLRSMAINAEVEWLKSQWLKGPCAK